jgi:acetylornithine deacetylase/succinyl-diaminopimelate desuccinylase-like protein
MALIMVFVMLSSGMVSAATTAPASSQSVKGAVEKIYANPTVQKGMAFIKADEAKTVEDLITICEIPAPPFKEKVRAEYYMKRLQELGLKDVKMDSEGNVFGVRSGTGKGPILLVAAHLDTVFPEGTDVTVKKDEDGILHAPGIGDDTAALASLLSIIRAFQDTGIKTVGDIIFCGDVGEEGLGDLRGVKALFGNNKNIDGFISIEPGSPDRITYLATGSHRYEVTFKGPGGHSFGAFGTPSPIHAMGRAIAKIAEIQVPQEPKTTFTVGVVNGGTSVNSIAEQCMMQVDMRSNDEEQVLRTEVLFKAAVYEALDEENQRWNSDKGTIVADMKMVGDRPAGSQDENSPIIQTKWAASEVMGETPQLSGPSSTDSNFPISIGVPAITIGCGGSSGNSHAPTEWFNPKDYYKGAQNNFLTILTLVGVDGVAEPTLPMRQK